MSAIYVLDVIALAQGAFLVLLLGFLVVRRRESRRRRQLFAGRQEAIMVTLRSWLAGTGSVADFALSLRGMPRNATLAYTSHLAASLVPVEQKEHLADALRDETWIRRMLGWSDDTNWWHRREAARALSLVGRADDRDKLGKLLVDPQPAVAVAAISALPRAADQELIGKVLDRYPTLPSVVRHYLGATLRQLRPMVEPALVARLVSTAPAQSLAHWLSLAWTLEIQPAIARAEALANHPDAVVRRAAARTLSRLPLERTVNLLRLLLADADPSVRAGAARSLGQIGATVAVQALERALHDSAWEVRYQSALALAALGDEGRAVLLAHRSDKDQYVADVSTLIAGLGEGALLELSVE